MRRNLVAGMVVACLVTFSQVRGEDDDGGSSVDVADTKASVLVAKAREGSLPLQVKALATVIVAPSAPSKISARGAGLVVRIAGKESDHVTSGTLVAELDPRPARAALAKAESALQRARREEDAAQAGGFDATQRELDANVTKLSDASVQLRREADRLTALSAKGMASTKAVADAESAAKAATDDAQLAKTRAERFRETEQANLSAGLHAATVDARADVEVARLDLESTLITAPGDGQLGTILLSPGDHVEAGSAVASFTPSEERWLSFLLPEAEADLVSLGAEVKEVGETARVSAISGEVDPATGLVRILAIPGSDAAKRRIGSMVSVTVNQGSSVAGIIVPAGALSYDADQAMVAIVDGSYARVIPVNVLSRSASEVCVEGEGLIADASVIVDGNANLADGAGIVVREAAVE